MNSAIQYVNEYNGDIVTQGYTIYKCSRCGEERRSDDGVPPASGGGGDNSLSTIDSEGIQQLRDKLSRMNAAVLGADMDPFYGAPEVLVVLGNKAVPTYVYDGSLVMGNMMNAAADLGVASCWVHRAKEEFESEEGKAILKELGIEGDYEGIGHLILGYAAKPVADPAPRKADYIYRA